MEDVTIKFLYKTKYFTYRFARLIIKFQELARQVEANLKRFDKKGKGKLTVDDYYNVIKVQNHFV